jgi:ribosomal protein L37AE/L43A
MNTTKVLSLMEKQEDDQESSVEQKPTLHFAATCPWCLSDDTKPVSLKYGVFECTKCGEVFNCDYDDQRR